MRLIKDNYSVDEVRTAIDNSEGWCINCKEFIPAYIEPDAREYTCVECEKPTMFGATSALLLDLIPLKDKRS